MSVLIPVHNGEGYIGKAIRSVLGQSFHDLEVLVLDDGSSDGSARVARTFGDKRVRVYRREQHEGVAATRNHLLMVARSPLIAFLDADDVALAERIGKQAAFLDRHRDFSLVACSYYQIDTQGQTLRRRALPPDHDGLCRRLLHGNALPASTVMLRREALDAAGGFEASMGLAAEYDLFLKISEKARVSAIGDPLVKCRVHSRAASYERRHELRDAIDRALRGAVRRRYRKPLTIATRSEEAPASLTAQSGETPTTAPADILLVAGEATVSEAATTTNPATVEATTEVATTPATIAELPTTAETTQVPSPPTEDPASPRQLLLTEVVEQETLSTTAGAPAGPVPAAASTTSSALSPDPDTTELAPAADASSSAETSASEPAGTGAEHAAVAVAAATTASPEEGSGNSEPPAVETITTPVAATPVAVPEPPTDRECTVAVVIEASGRAALPAIRSVLDQTLADLVVAVVATSHDDGLERGLELLGDERVLYLECEGGSRAKALNLGILATRSRYLAYLGENGVYRSEHLDRLVQAAETDRLGLVYSDLGLATVGVPGTLVSGRDYDGELLLKENFIPAETVLHRRDLLHEVGLFNEGLDEGMEWEMWVYLTRVGAARRIPHATVERVVGGPKSARLIATSPNRVRRHLAEKFSKGDASTSLASASMPEPLGPDGAGVARAQQRIRSGDWAGAAVEIVDAASRQLSALSQLFSPRYPEREVPLTEMPHRLLADDSPALRSRPRLDAQAELTAESPAVAADRAMPADILPHRLQATAGPAASANGISAASSWGPASEPPAAAWGAAAAPVEAALAEEPAPDTAVPPPGVNTGGWLYVGGQMLPRPRSSPLAAGRPGAARPAGARGSGLARPTASVLPYNGSKRRKPIENVTEHPACPLCGAGNTALAYRAGWYRVLDCKACDLGFSFPTFEPSRAARFFSDRRPEIVPPHIRKASDCLGSRYDRSRELGWARKYVREGRLVDVGCSWGFALAQAAEVGFDPFGTELSRVLARTARERFGFEIKERDFSELELEEGSLDVVLAVHVVQHMVDPRGFFTAAERSLRRGGVMVGSLPNFDSYLREELGRRWKWFDPECQPYHFRPASLMAFLRTAGFEPEVWTSEGLYGEDALLELVTAEEAATLARGGRGSEIGFIARKR